MHECLRGQLKSIPPPPPNTRIASLEANSPIQPILRIDLSNRIKQAKARGMHDREYPVAPFVCPTRTCLTAPPPAPTSDKKVDRVRPVSSEEAVPTPPAGGGMPQERLRLQTRLRHHALPVLASGPVRQPIGSVPLPPRSGRAGTRRRVAFAGRRWRGRGGGGDGARGGGFGET